MHTRRRMNTTATTGGGDDDHDNVDGCREAGNNGGIAATTLSDLPTPVAAATIGREAPVPTLDQIAGIDVRILVMRLQIRRERGRWARLM